MLAIYALMHTGTHQTSYIRSVKERGRRREGGREVDGETDNVRHKHTEKKMMDGWGKTGVSEVQNEPGIGAPEIIDLNIYVN